jgi:hypothetical protein
MGDSTNIVSREPLAIQEVISTMYGPPRDCKGEVWPRRQVCANVFGLYVEIVSPGHDELRAYPSL